MRILPIIITFAVTLYALFDCARTPQESVRSLPKWGWLLIVILLSPLGSIAWLFAGRPKRNPGSGNNRGSGGPRRPIAPDDDPDFLRNL
ncbi:unannotated protein [freshwater metagenome]|jgi:hypothetical protein|uniref:Unannotated protein n=1 Tax=freshwater metagenome TaxID=449393 RepID=A0A6J6IDP7_9ZZZZ|nr:hypothetical protein [Actinomycetota bacterium]MSW98448.1 hypothetical protein [Actinomycetota bacterium]MSY81909.1 hypothetical protein [Actinomycetota bacterium]MSZ46212.1 hypothetical protein [Actinomycetota bacterium]MTA04423.1 hypothetical protein [Actinomycetota bacterium]